MKTSYLLLYVAFIFTLLAGCGGQPTNRSTQQPIIADTIDETQSTTDQIQTLLDSALTSDSPLREQQLLLAAQLLIKEEQRDLAEQVINNLNVRELPLELYAFYAELLCRINIQRGLYEQAQSILEAPRLLNNIATLSADMQIKLSLLRAEVFALLGSHLASAQQRIYIGPLLDTPEQQANQEGIWQSLMYVPIEELQQSQKTAISKEYRGWLELALIGKDSQGDLDEQLRQLQNWQRQWFNHPASQNLPGGLELIKELATNRAQQVALLLPLTGKLAPFGKAVRDGFVAAMYQTRRKGGQIPRLKFYDTEQNSDFLALYYQAVAEGAQVIVGPLEKQRVRLLFDELSLPVPTLALNRIDDYGEPAQQLFQFGLAPQDEAKQVASIAYLENHRKALIISPKGEWGDKVASSFNTYWQQMGAQTIATSIYSGQADYSNSIKESLLLATSEQRAKRIERLVGENIEFSPRRRSDIDMVFLLARPKQARSIKPLLAYHYAGELPVYATSHLYSGISSSKRDRDINGVRFTDMPWVLNRPELHQLIDKEIPQSKQYQRMFALGVDSFQLFPRLRQLKEINSSRVYGQTGTLKLNERKEIEREMLFARIRSGLATIIPAATLTPDLSLTTKEGAENDISKKRSFINRGKN